MPVSAALMVEIGLIDRVLQCREIVGAAVETLGGEVGHRPIDRTVDLVAGRQTLLRSVQLAGQLLQQKEVAANTAG